MCYENENRNNISYERKAKPPIMLRSAGFHGLPRLSCTHEITWNHPAKAGRQIILDKLLRPNQCYVIEKNNKPCYHLKIDNTLEGMPPFRIPCRRRAGDGPRVFSGGCNVKGDVRILARTLPFIFQRCQGRACGGNASHLASRLVLTHRAGAFYRARSRANSLRHRLRMRPGNVLHLVCRHGMRGRRNGLQPEHARPCG